jgi:hypothetical protein
MTEALKRKVSCKHDANLPADGFRGDVAHIHAIDLDGAFGHIVEARQQVDDGGLACASGTHNRKSLTGLGGKGNTLQDGYAVFIFM